MKSNPFFSIVIPTYNRANLLKKTLESFVKQTFEDFEVIIVDDGGKDHTKEVVESFGEPRFRYYWKENAERNAARNYGAQQAQGKYINWFDSDDLALNYHLASIYNFLQSNQFPPIVHSNYNVIDTHGKELQKPNEKPALLNEILYKGNCISTNNIIVETSIALQNLFEEDRNLLSEDYELWMRLAAQYPILQIQEHTTSVVFHGQRSMFSPKSSQELIQGYTLFIEYIVKNKSVVSFLGTNYHYFLMRNYLILAVELANNNHKKDAIHYLYKATKSSLKSVWDISFYATLKHLIFK
jgi:glycosyltransferase involved in cell wall biosynthesis